MMLEGASLFELPVTRGARVARIGIVLLLDAILLIAGVALLMSYLDLRAERGGGQISAAEPRPATGVDLEELAPTVVDRHAGRASPDGVATAAPGDVSPQVPPAGKAPLEGGKGGDTTASPKPARPATGTPTSPSGASPSGAGPASAGRIDAGVAAPPGGGGSPTDREPAGDGGGIAIPSPADPDAGAASGGEAPPPAETVTDEDIGRFTSQVALLVRRNRGQLERCYTVAAKATTPTEPLEGKVEVQFTVTAAGTASGAAVVSNSSGSDQLARCVAALIESWSFPSPPLDQPVELVWAFPFKAMR